MVLMSSNGRVLEAMEFDADGQASAVTRHPWLETLANDRKADEGPRMSVAARLTLPMDLWPSNEFHWETSEVVTVASMVHEVPNAALEQETNNSLLLSFLALFSGMAAIPAFCSDSDRFLGAMSAMRSVTR
jgi:hypothetical protein